MRRESEWRRFTFLCLWFPHWSEVSLLSANIIVWKEGMTKHKDPFLHFLNEHGTGSSKNVV
jgi:hypothetical protein